MKEIDYEESNILERIYNGQTAVRIPRRALNALARDERGADSPAVRPEPVEGYERRADSPAVRPEPVEGYERGADSPAVRPEPVEGYERRADSPAVRPEPVEGYERRADSPAVRPEPVEGYERQTDSLVVTHFFHYLNQCTVPTYTKYKNWNRTTPPNA